MPRGKKAGTPEVRPDINVTPLVDIVLVLLIICMVVAPRLDQDVPVELPGVFNPDPEVQRSEPLKLTVARAGAYYIDDRLYDLESAIHLLNREHANDPLRQLVLRADSKLTYGQVREVLARTRQIGFPGLSLLVSERHGGADRARAPDAPHAPPPAQLAAAAAPLPGQSNATGVHEGGPWQ
jgi:biopolymer transport protein TolR